MKRRPLITLWVLLVVFQLTVGTALARSVFQGERCHLEADKTVEGTLYVLCEALQIDGVVTGDVIGLAFRSRVRGDIQGSVYLGGNKAVFSGSVQDSLHYVGLSLELMQDNPANGALSRKLPSVHSLKFAALSAVIGPGVSIRQDVIALGYQAFFEGNTLGEIQFWGSAIELNGYFGGDVYATVGDTNADGSQIDTLLIPLNVDIELRDPGLEMAPDALIEGNLLYRAPQKALLPGTIRGSTRFEALNQTALPSLEEPGSFSIYVNQFIREVITLLSVGAALLWTLPNITRLLLDHLRKRPFASVSVGMLAFILSFPFVLISVLASLLLLVLLQITGFGGLVVVVGVLATMLNVGGASLFYFVAIFIARALFGLAIGHFILRIVRVERRSMRQRLLALVIGIFVLALLVSLPLVGWIFNATALFFGLGAILTAFLNQLRRMRERAPHAATNRAASPAVLQRRTQPHSETPTITIHEPPRQPDSTQSNPPRLSAPNDNSNHPGMQDLPEGFDMRFFEND